MLSVIYSVNFRQVQLTENEIRPQDLFNEYLRLSAQDIPGFFSDATLTPVACVACGNRQTKMSFEKHGFKYDECDNCRSLFMNPRPDSQTFAAFYEKAPSNHYWSAKFFPAVAEVRREKIFKPRAQGIFNLLQKNGKNPQVIMDVGAGAGIFLEEWRKLQPQADLRAVEPGDALSEVCRSKNLKVLQTTAENAQAWHGQADLVVCFEVIEHVHQVDDFLSSLVALAKPGGSVVVSGLGIDGFDIQMLWKNSKSISPPHHINFMSVDGFTRAFKRSGLTEIEVLTPGLLDVDILKNAMKENIWEPDRWWELVFSRGDECLRDLQEFLRKHQLSSHLWAVGTKESR